MKTGRETGSAEQLGLNKGKKTVKTKIKVHTTSQAIMEKYDNLSEFFISHIVLFSFKIFHIRILLLFGFLS